MSVYGQTGRSRLLMVLAKMFFLSLLGVVCKFLWNVVCKLVRVQVECKRYETNDISVGLQPIS